MASEFLSIIADRRDGRKQSEASFTELANGAARGTIPDYQLAAWLMAAYLNPLSAEETAWLTLAMAHSGERIDLTGLPKPWVDKHSTGGVGDKTSIVALPILAACGLTIVKMSGRGLGITGGTVDKLASISGFRLDLSPEEMKDQALKIGLALTGQSSELAPADKVLYALRDVTGTVGSISLIVSSILSKKIAGGADTIMLDVKAGSGAFMKSPDEARQLARALEETAKRCGLAIRLTISDMSEPLGAAVGNALEVQEALDVLNPAARVGLGAPSLRFRELCVSLCAHTLQVCGLAMDLADGVERVVAALDSGAAWRKACEWFVAQGGNDPSMPSFCLPRAAFVSPVRSSADGWVNRIQCDTVGQAVVDLGGGRIRKEDTIDPSVGVVFRVCVGSRVRVGDVLFEVHSGSPEAGERASGSILGGLEVSSSEAKGVPPVLEVL